MEEFEEMKRRCFREVEELLGVSLIHVFTTLLLFFLSEKKNSMQKHATNGQGDFMKRHGFIG